MKIRNTLLVSLVLLSFAASAQRIPVLNQIDLPHNYYFRELYLPQLTSGPSSVSWMPDGKQLVYSMAGSLWIQQKDSEKATQLTDGNGYDYQPDVSPDGKRIVFVRYNGSADELMVFDFATRETKSLTSNNAVNLEPRWSPDGKKIAYVSTSNTGHFLLYQATVENNTLTHAECLTPDRKSTVKRYYYSAFDHAVNPTWSRDGKKIYFISNRDIEHGTGDIVTIDVNTKELNTLHHEETSWRTRPDISPDGTRMVYSSYVGRNWHQLWLLPSAGGYPFPITYGEYDNTSPRWSPDGKEIAFISNREGNTSLWIINAFDGGQHPLKISELQYVRPRTSITIEIRDENGKLSPARISVMASREKFYAPRGSWIQADDSRYPNQHQFESHYFHSAGTAILDVPKDSIIIQISHGPEYEITRVKIDSRQSITSPIEIKLSKQKLPAYFGNWWSGDLHVHMNYGGSYKTTPEILASQAEAEHLNFVFDLIVNKEQRVPDINAFTPTPFSSQNNQTKILHSQEFHTSFWGHLGLLNLQEHVILPGYVGYPETAVQSLFPHNSFIADRAHAQNGLVGYVHPFEQSEVFPDQSSTLFNELPVDVALGKVNYYELIGFSDHKASEAVWYKLLNCGFHLPAGAGTDAMANYASLRGPVGTNRVYVKSDGNPDHAIFLKRLAEGKSFVTNGPIIGLTVEGKSSGDSIVIASKGQTLSYTAFLRSQVPIDHFEIIWNGEVIAHHKLKAPTTTLDTKGSIKLKGSGWLLLRAWSDKAHVDLFDLYPYASTNPIYIKGTSKNIHQKDAANYFLKWVNRIEAKTEELPFRNSAEKDLVLKDVREAKSFYLNLPK